MSLNYTRVLVPDIPYVCPETGQRLTARFIYRFHQYCAEVSYSVADWTHTRLHCLAHAKRYGPKKAEEMKQRFYRELPGFVKTAETEWFEGKPLIKEEECEA